MKSSHRYASTEKLAVMMKTPSCLIVRVSPSSIAITDTAVAAKRPPSDKLYDALRLLGAPQHMEKIGYRFPFAFLGCKGGAGHSERCGAGMFVRSIAKRAIGGGDPRRMRDTELVRLLGCTPQ